MRLSNGHETDCNGTESGALFFIGQRLETFSPAILPSDILLNGHLSMKRPTRDCMTWLATMWLTGF